MRGVTNTLREVPNRFDSQHYNENDTLSNRFEEENQEKSNKQIFQIPQMFLPKMFQIPQMFLPKIFQIPQMFGQNRGKIYR